jgi:pimeloyl-ACP methyl ester carboxylesterase
MKRNLFITSLLGSLLLATLSQDANARPPATSSATHAEPVVRYHTASVDGIDVFYREAGDPSAPTVLLLHGFPTSSHMYRRLIPVLAQRYHVVAPDYPGFGQSSAPASDDYAYTFENLAHIVNGLVESLQIERYSLYVMDYGAPIGFRLAMAHPERVEGLIVQNGNAYEEGLQEFWDPFRSYWSGPSSAKREALRPLLNLGTTQFQYLDGVSDPSLISPDTWTLDQSLLDRPGNQEIQLDLFFDYRTNVDLYPAFHRYFRKYQPPTLVVWGKNDFIFPKEGASAFKRDLPRAEIHLLDTGHFALESHFNEISKLMLRFLERTTKR